MSWADRERSLRNVDQRAEQCPQLLRMRCKFRRRPFTTCDLNRSFNGGRRTRFAHTLPEGVIFTADPDSNMSLWPKQHVKPIPEQYQRAAEFGSSLSFARGKHHGQTRHTIIAHRHVTLDLFPLIVQVIPTSRFALRRILHRRVIRGV